MVNTVHSPSPSPCASPTPSRPASPPTTGDELDLAAVGRGRSSVKPLTSADTGQDETLTTDADGSFDKSSQSSSLRHIPDIVEELINRKKTQNSTSETNLKTIGIHAADSYNNKIDHPVTSDDELLNEPPSKFHEVDDDTQDLFKPRAFSDPVHKHRKKTIMSRLSERKPKLMRRRHSPSSSRRRKSLELLERAGQPQVVATPPSVGLRRSGVKSDGDDLSAGEDYDHQNSPSRGNGVDGKRMNALATVRSRGRDLVGEMKTVGSGVKKWTKKNMPTINR